MKEIKAIIQPFLLDRVLLALEQRLDLPGVTISPVAGWGRTRGRNAAVPTAMEGRTFAQKLRLEIVVHDNDADAIVALIAREAHTGNIGDGKIFVYDVRDAVRIRTGERGADALGPTVLVGDS